MLFPLQRGSEGIKKYLRSRVEVPADSPSNKPTPAVQKAGTSGQSGLFGGGDQIDAHSVKLSKALDYRYGVNKGLHLNLLILEILLFIFC